jgi:hypothetical protein
MVDPADGRPQWRHWRGELRFSYHAQDMADRVDKGAHKVSEAAKGLKNSLKNSRPADRDAEPRLRAALLSAHAVIEPAGESGCVESVEDTVRADPAFAGHRHAPAGRRVYFRDRVSVRIDAEEAAQFKAALVPAPIQIKPPGIAVDLHRHAVFGAGGENPLDIETVARTTQELSSGQVADDADKRIRDGAQQALGLGLAVHPKLAVHAADDEIEAA